MKFLKYFFASIFFLIGFFGLLAGILEPSLRSFLSGSLFIATGLILIPMISTKLKSSFPFWKERKTRIITTIITPIIALILTGVFTINESKYGGKENIIIEYLQNNFDDRSLQNIRLFDEAGNVFSNGGYSFINLETHIQGNGNDDISSNVFTFDPGLGLKKGIQIGYLRPDIIKGELQEYKINFQIEDEEIILIETILTYSKSGSEIIENEFVPDLSNLINQEKVKARRADLRMEEEQKQKTIAFKENCIDGLDDRHIELTQKVKRLMHNPDSFEHDGTRFEILYDHALVTMYYRGTNKFNAIVRNEVKAKVSLKDCSVVEIF